MSEPAPRGDPLYVERRPASGRRRRSAPDHEETSDERRWSGLAVASVVGAVTVLLAVGWVATPRSLRSPGPLAKPHRDAAIDCAQCHDAEPLTDACVGCHGPHPSTRKGHTRLRGATQPQPQPAMGCTTCHRVHDDFGGVAVAADGAVSRFGPGAETPLGLTAAPGVGPGIVPVIPMDACAGCHDVTGPRDPIARCVHASVDAPGSPRPSMCFDEHREVTQAGVRQDPALRRRMALWAVARQALARAPVAPRGTPPARPGFWIVALGLAAAAAVWLAWRMVGRLRRARRRRPPATADGLLRPPEIKRLPAIDTNTCIGCYACVDVCPYDVLAVRDYVAVVVRPDDCCGLTLCEQRCPNGSLRITEGEPIGDRPRIDVSLQSTDTPGLYLAGDVTGLPLIRNAIGQGQTAVTAIAASLRGEPPGVATHDLVIVGAGPAGLSAALAAKAAKLRYVVLEQGSMAESIRSFPRGKLVFDQPLGLPLVGDLWLAESTKEELLSKWRRIVREHAIDIREGVRVATIDREGGAFVVTPAEGPSLSARRVLLAMGRRGTPRRLPCPLPEDCVDRVHYHLADARSFAGRRVVVVGLGDVAMEAAVALAAQPETSVTLVARGDAFRRGKQRNVDAVQRAVAAGRMQLKWRSQVAAVTAAAIELETDGPDGGARLPWDALFVMVGAIAPWDFLQKAGVQRAGSGAEPDAMARPRLPVVQ